MLMIIISLSTPMLSNRFVYLKTTLTIRKSQSMTFRDLYCFVYCFLDISDKEALCFVNIDFHLQHSPASTVVCVEACIVLCRCCLFDTIYWRGRGFKITS